MGTDLRGSSCVVQRRSVCTVIPAPPSPGGSYKTSFVRKNPTYVWLDITALRTGWKATRFRSGSEAHRVVDLYVGAEHRDPEAWNPYFEPVIAGLRFESPKNPEVRVDVVVGWRRRVDGEWKLWFHA
ncbi:HET domain-containing protein [Colletotrichum higginsianum IMI 349063]|uniref:HET domain-containing protein n=1 Tax=Colletotrichum higginsianum (strain IMI 349063) TaxID=759273 RepID=A0A1B7YX10_COLHI|nr:HET domain-containing protein [Colletotrichum higginsianum IMI 349063]OBR16576.1 HET domain-containing protein [Colletotrichum higginsianum IMI 349063]